MSQRHESKRLLSREHKEKRGSAQQRYTVALPPAVADQVHQCAVRVDASMSKAITALVTLGLESQEERKRHFFRSLRENLANDDPLQEDRLVDGFRALILGR